MGLGCTLPESQQENGLSVGAGGPREHPDAKTIRARAHARGRETYNNSWLIERHGYLTPEQFRQKQLQPNAMAA
jgi:hypothetical protein